MSESSTPLTDGEIDDARNVALNFECRNPPPGKDENVYVVPAEFARQLEREINRMRQSCEWADSTRLRLAKVFDCAPTASDVCLQAEKFKRELADARANIEDLRSETSELRRELREGH